MKTLEASDCSEVKEVDNCVKNNFNKWRWEWKNEKDELVRPFSLWVRKVDVPGAALCIICNRVLQYGSSGKKTLSVHSKDDKHLLLLRLQKDTQTVPGAEECTHHLRKQTKLPA